jgi:hypothetical protein
MDSLYEEAPESIPSADSAVQKGGIPVSPQHELLDLSVDLVGGLARAFRGLAHGRAQEGGAATTAPGHLPHLLAHPHAGHHQLRCP